MTLSAHQRPYKGDTDEWLTPPGIIQALGPFDLDPCAAMHQPWPTADRHFTVFDDGLAQDWTQDWPEQGLSKPYVWCNPPFGPEAEKWLEAMASHDHGIALVPARTETRWFVRTVWKEADCILFLHGRPHFHYIDGTRAKANCGAPIALVGYGAYAVERLRSCSLTGSLIHTWEETPIDPN